MRKVKRVVCLLVLAFFVAGSLALTTGTGFAGKVQEKCPIMGGKIDKSNYVDYKGKRIYFCCPACPDEFKKDPDKYMKKMEEEGIVLEDAPKAQ